MSKGLHYEDVLITKDELSGKYSSIIHKDGKNYARICYNGDEIYAPHTYCDKYLKEHKLGKYGPGGAYYEAEEKAKKDREKSKDKKSSCSSCSGSLCDSIIDSIPGLRCIIDCCC